MNTPAQNRRRIALANAGPSSPGSGRKKFAPPARQPRSTPKPPTGRRARSKLTTLDRARRT